MKPKEVNDAKMLFGVGIGDYMPDYIKIPDEFKRGNTKQNEIVTQWFFKGLPNETKFKPKNGIDAGKALRHITTIMRSFEIKHEVKEASCAYLLSQWFDKIEIPAD